MLAKQSEASSIPWTWPRRVRIMKSEKLSHTGWSYVRKLTVLNKLFRSVKEDISNLENSQDKLQMTELVGNYLNEMFLYIAACTTFEASLKEIGS